MSYYRKQTNIQKIDNICKCINEFNKTGLVTNILAKKLNPILYLKDIDEQLPYTHTDSSFTTLHVGQLKLLIGEIYFCTLANKSHIDAFTFVYAGSSPNNKGFILNDMFPNMKTILIDPAEHLLYLTSKENTSKENTSKENTSKENTSKENTSKENTSQKENIVKTQYNQPNKILYLCCANTNRFKIKNRIVYIFDGINIRKLNRDSADVKIISDKWHTYINSFTSDNIFSDDPYLNVIHKVIACEPGYETFNNIIIEDYFTDNMALFCKQLPNIIFACDIRTNAYDMMQINTSGKKDITDLDICFNSAMMLSWVNIMQPRLTMLKFRPPYYMSKEKAIFNKYCDTDIYKYYFDKVKHQIDFVADYQTKKFNYIIGDEILQAYAGTTSGETRLIFNELKFGLIDHLKREGNLFYYNQIRRQYGYHNTYTDPISGVDNCGDCALAQKIISMYSDKYQIDSNISLKYIMSILHRPLNIHNHGQFLSINKNIKDVYKQYGRHILNKLIKYKKTDQKITDQIIDGIGRYQFIKTYMQKYNKDIVSEQFISRLSRLFRYYSIYYLMYNIQNKSTAYEYCYYELIIKQGLTKSNAIAILSEFKI
jgi:hypothetical protein